MRSSASPVEQRAARSRWRSVIWATQTIAAASRSSTLRSSALTRAFGRVVDGLDQRCQVTRATRSRSASRLPAVRVAVGQRERRCRRAARRRSTRRRVRAQVGQLVVGEQRVRRRARASHQVTTSTRRWPWMSRGRCRARRRRRRARLEPRAGELGRASPSPRVPDADSRGANSASCTLVQAGGDAAQALLGLAPCPRTAACSAGARRAARASRSPSRS